MKKHVTLNDLSYMYIDMNSNKYEERIQMKTSYLEFTCFVHVQNAFSFIRKS